MFSPVFCFYSNCSEASRDSVGHFGWNSLPPSLACSRSPPPAPPLSLKEAAFCDLQIGTGHVTPTALSITRRGRPTSLLKGTAPCPRRGRDFPLGKARLPDGQTTSVGMPKSRQPRALFLRCSGGHTTLALTSRGNHILSTTPSRFKNKKRFVFSPQLIWAVTRLSTPHAHTNLRSTFRGMRTCWATQQTLSLIPPRLFQASGCNSSGRRSIVSSYNFHRKMLQRLKENLRTLHCKKTCRTFPDIILNVQEQQSSETVRSTVSRILPRGDLLPRQAKAGNKCLNWPCTGTMPMAISLTAAWEAHRSTLRIDPLKCISFQSSCKTVQNSVESKKKPPHWQWKKTTTE